ncbi:MAG TPA: prenyltransferase/squalene oxidase repeat-containing protein [Solirubrobacterales bacterium]|nr:prenyltransferase/squalene oxidase repeat-containing protein [Solirubrobacterales bacterium]
MSWQVASFLILGAVLLAGFAWYERSRPPAQIVALVAALAALAIAGRIAFAAFPNVKPTTDIVVFAGYALGPAPGFAVGALAGLVSNFWFGQGPWTPWQMAGWGMCGLLGAALALGVRNAGRLSLAATCGLAGILYGALLNFSLMATYGGDLSLERFGVLAARAVPFDAAHAIGNVVFALIAGPAMVRMLARFRERFEWGRRGPAAPEPTPPPRRRLTPRLRGGGIAGLLLVVLLAGALAPARAGAADLNRATFWLAAVQNEDGGFGSAPGDKSGAEMTSWAVLGLAAAGHSPLDVSRGGKTPVDFLRNSLNELQTPGDLARTILAFEAAGVDSRNVKGADMVAVLLGERRSNGSYGPKSVGWPNSTAFAVLALRAAGADGSVGPSLDWLRKVQNDDGGWGDVPGSPSTADGTGAVLQALSPGSKAARRGLSYLRETQRPGGGFPLGGNGEVNTQSTAWAVQGILAAGGDPGSYRRGGASALDYLTARQDADGHFRYSKSSNQTPVWVTSQALMAAAEKPLPIAPTAPTSKPAKKKKSSTGGFSATPGSSGSSSPSTAPPPSSPPNPGATAVPPTTPEGGSPGVPPNVLRPPGESTPEAPATPDEPGGRERGDTGAASSELSSDDDESSTGGAILLGLAAGALLFGLGLGGRRLWQRWRYGI